MGRKPGGPVSCIKDRSKSQPEAQRDRSGTLGQGELTQRGGIYCLMSERSSNKQHEKGDFYEYQL